MIIQKKNNDYHVMITCLSPAYHLELAFHITLWDDPLKKSPNLLGPKVDMAETVAAVGTVTVVTETVTVDQGAGKYWELLGK